MIIKTIQGHQLWEKRSSRNSSAKNLCNDVDLNSTLDMLLQLIQQWTEALIVRHEIRAVTLDISHAFDTVWHQPDTASLSKLSAYGIQGQLHS